MKVCTDACLFGAWTARRFSASGGEHTLNRILDIGTGTGLLAIMIAQQINVPIDAIEIDKEASAQATENVQASRWSQQVNVIHGDVKNHMLKHGYDLIISNPPFYENDLKSGNEAKDRAMHDTGLTMDALIEVVSKNLLEAGYFAMLIPAHRSHFVSILAEKKNLQVVQQLLVKPTPKHAATRVILLFRHIKAGGLIPEIKKEEINIKEVHHNYSLPFINLLQEYYLSL